MLSQKGEATASNSLSARLRFVLSRLRWAAFISSYFVVLSVPTCRVLLVDASFLNCCAFFPVVVGRQPRRAAVSCHSSFLLLIFPWLHGVSRSRFLRVLVARANFHPDRGRTRNNNRKTRVHQQVGEFMAEYLHGYAQGFLIPILWNFLGVKGFIP